MNADVETPFDWTSAIEAIRSATLPQYQPSDELVRLRRRLVSVRGDFLRTLIDHLAANTHVDLDSIYGEARRRNEAQRLYVTQVLEKLETRARNDALEDRRQLDLMRAAYLRDFPRPFEFPPGSEEIKFNIPIFAFGTATPAECMTVFGGGFSDPNFGTQEASAEMRVTLGEPGVELFPRIYTDNGDCELTTLAQTFHELFFRRGGLGRSFAVSGVRVDLFGVGLSSSHWGDLGWGFDPSSDVTATIDLSVEIAQIVDGRAQYIAVLNKQNLFTQQDETTHSVRILTSLDNNPVNLLLRGQGAGGGEIGCYLILRTRANVKGAEGGRVRLDFSSPDYGLALTGVSLIGQSLG